MSIQLSPLPFGTKDLQPIISEETLNFHYSKHHKGYVDKTNAQIEGTSFDKANLKQILMDSNGILFNLSAQAWNHEFYWNGLYAAGQKQMPSDLLKAIEKDFESLANFKKKFTKEALNHFGSGWAWLIKNNDKLDIISTHDADTPLKHGKTPLLTCDVWEHAYYIDYRNNRASYLDGFWKIINWEFVARNLFS